MPSIALSLHMRATAPTRRNAIEARASAHWWFYTEPLRQCALSCCRGVLSSPRGFARTKCLSGGRGCSLVARYSWILIASECSKGCAFGSLQSQRISGDESDDNAETAATALSVLNYARFTEAVTNRTPDHCSGDPIGLFQSDAFTAGMSARIVRDLPNRRVLGELVESTNSKRTKWRTDAVFPSIAAKCGIKKG